MSRIECPGIRLIGDVEQHRDMIPEHTRCPRSWDKQVQRPSEAGALARRFRAPVGGACDITPTVSSGNPRSGLRMRAVPAICLWHLDSQRIPLASGVELVNHQGLVYASGFVSELYD